MHLSYKASFLIVCFGIASIHGFQDAKTDICGDPVVTDDMINDPMKVIDYLMDLDSNKRAQERCLDKNDFLLDLEAGKMTRDRMKDFIIQIAYAWEKDIRTMAAGFNKFGFAYPVMEGRDFFEYTFDRLRTSLDRLTALGKAFDVADIKELVQHEPNPIAMGWSHALSEGVMHAQDHSEIVVAHAVIDNDFVDLMHRMKAALQTNGAYKSWNMSDDALRFFDAWDLNADEKEIAKRIVIEVVARGLRQEVTICQLRRRLNNWNVGRVLFWDAMSDQTMPHSYDSHKSVGF